MNMQQMQILARTTAIQKFKNIIYGGHEFFQLIYDFSKNSLNRLEMRNGNIAFLFFLKLNSFQKQIIYTLVFLPHKEINWKKVFLL